MLEALAALWLIGVMAALIALWARVSDAAKTADVRRLQREIDRLSARLDGLLRDRESAVATPESPAKPLPPPDVTGAEPSPAVAPVVPPQFRETPASAPTYPDQGLRWRPPREFEALVGGNWLLKIGILAIVLGVLYFVKYAFDNRWIGNAGRVLIGGFTGAAFVGAGELFHRRGYRRYGPTIAAGGISILYLAVYAAFNFYTLIGNAPALVLMALITASGALLAAHYPSRTLAVLSLLGGILTPYWLSTGQNNQVGLLTYLLILDLGMGMLSRARQWPVLNWISFVGTVALFGGWAARFYTTGAAALTELYLVLFVALYGWLDFSVASGNSMPARRHLFAIVAIVLFFFASDLNLDHNATSFWGFLVSFAAAAVGWSVWKRERFAANGALVLTALAVAGWLPGHFRTADAYTVALFATLTLGIFLAHQVFGSKWALTPGPPDVVAALGAAFGYFGVMYTALRQLFPDSMGLMAVALAVLYLALARVAARPIASALLGASVSFVTLAIPIQFHRESITMAWAAEALVLGWIGFAGRSVRLRQAGLAVLLLGIVRLIGWDSRQLLLHYTLLWNRRAIAFAAVIAAAYLLAWLYRRNAEELEEWERDARTALVLVASAVTVVLISLENWSYFGEKLNRLLPGDDPSPVRNSRRMLLSVLWSAYSIVAVSAGIRLRYRPIRLFGIALFFLAILKVFFVDIWMLQRLYRIISVITLGSLLLGVAFLYQRFSRRESGNARR